MWHGVSSAFLLPLPLPPLSPSSCAMQTPIFVSVFQTSSALPRNSWRNSHLQSPWTQDAFEGVRGALRLRTFKMGPQSAKSHIPRPYEDDPMSLSSLWMPSAQWQTLGWSLRNRFLPSTDDHPQCSVQVWLGDFNTVSSERPGVVQARVNPDTTEASRSLKEVWKVPRPKGLHLAKNMGKG